MTPVITDRERALLAQNTWSVDELITLAYGFRRVVVELDGSATSAPSQRVSSMQVSPLTTDERAYVRKVRRAANEHGQVAGYFKPRGKP
jgi:hypothetical protein